MPATRARRHARGTVPLRSLLLILLLLGYVPRNVVNRLRRARQCVSISRVRACLVAGERSEENSVYVCVCVCAYTRACAYSCVYALCVRACVRVTRVPVYPLRPLKRMSFSLVAVVGYGVTYYTTDCSRGPFVLQSREPLVRCVFMRVRLFLRLSRLRKIRGGGRSANRVSSPRRGNIYSRKNTTSA